MQVWPIVMDDLKISKLDRFRFNFFFNRDFDFRSEFLLYRLQQYTTVWDTAVPAEGNGNLQTLICVLVARPRRCLTLSNPVP